MGYDEMIDFDAKFKEGRRELSGVGLKVDAIDREMRGKHKTEGYGLCDTCVYFTVIESDYGTLYSICSRCNPKNFRPTRIKPITKCSDYWNRAYYSFYELKEMAWLIDDKKEGAGFIKPYNETP
jgi:hypothetical protein